MTIFFHLIPIPCSYVKKIKIEDEGWKNRREVVHSLCVTIPLTMKVAEPVPLYSPITLHQVTGHNRAEQACSVSSLIQLLYICFTQWSLFPLLSITYTNSQKDLTCSWSSYLLWTIVILHQSLFCTLTLLSSKNQLSFCKFCLLGLHFDFLFKNINTFKSPNP